MLNRAVDQEVQITEEFDIRSIADCFVTCVSYDVLATTSNQLDIDLAPSQSLQLSRATIDLPSVPARRHDAFDVDLQAALSFGEFRLYCPVTGRAGDGSVATTTAALTTTRSWLAMADDNDTLESRLKRRESP